MVRGVIHRIAGAAGALAVAAAMVFALAPSPASAAPAKKPKPDAVTITGAKAPSGLTVRAADDPELFASVYGQVNWLADATPQMGPPKRDRLGDKYVVTILIGTAAQQAYELYPNAVGGPRAYRPAKQPKGKATPGWFYGRLSMPLTLRMSGVDLPEDTSLITGGFGGGARVADDGPVDYAKDVDGFLGELRQLVLLNGAVVLTIAVGLAGMSYLVRRKV